MLDPDAKGLKLIQGADPDNWNQDGFFKSFPDLEDVAKWWGSRTFPDHNDGDDGGGNGRGGGGVPPAPGADGSSPGGEARTGSSEHADHVNHADQPSSNGHNPYRYGEFPDQHPADQPLITINGARDSAVHVTGEAAATTTTTLDATVFDDLDQVINHRLILINRGEEGESAIGKANSTYADQVISVINRNPPCFVASEEELSEVVAALEGALWVAIDLEGDLAVHAGREGVRVMSLYAGDVAYKIDCHAVDVAPLRRVLREPDVYVHGKEYDLPTLIVNFGFEFEGQIYDTLHASRCAYPGSYLWAGDLGGESVFEEIKHSLADAVRRELPEVVEDPSSGLSDPKTKSKFQDVKAWLGTKKSGLPELTEDHARYAGEDMLHLKALHDALIERLGRF
jgi:hypothetical protein